MPRSRQGRPITASVAIFAVLLAALAMSISQRIAAIQWAAYSDETERCSMEESRADDVADLHAPLLHASHTHQNIPPSDDHGTHFEHCPFCFTHAGSFGVPPTAEFNVSLISSSTAMPKLFLHSSRTLFVWAAAQARAPPALYWRAPRITRDFGVISEPSV
jgi:hypothetical protein